MQLIDGSKRIDAVIEPFGQLPHDMVAGAFICRQAGAVIVDPSGNELDLGAVLSARSLRQTVPFVAANHRNLALSLCRDLSQASAAFGSQQRVKLRAIDSPLAV